MTTRTEVIEKAITLIDTAVAVSTGSGPAINIPSPDRLMQLADMYLRIATSMELDRREPS